MEGVNLFSNNLLLVTDASSVHGESFGASPQDMSVQDESVAIFSNLTGKVSVSNRKTIQTPAFLKGDKGGLLPSIHSVFKIDLSV